MPNITDLNGVAVASITDINGVAIGSISDINGLTVSTFSGLLDDYSGAAAAYSTRRLNSAYTGAAMRVREDGTDTETDIGFDSNGDLDTAAISTHCGVNNGYVVTWYDQATAGGTGSGNDATQSTTGSQPQIYNGTAVLTQNGKPRIEFASGKQLLMTFGTGGTSAVFYSVQANPSTSCIPFLSTGIVPAPYLQRWIDNDSATVVYRNVGTPSTYANGTLLSSPTLDDIYEAIAANNQALLLTFCDTSTMNGLSTQINHAGATSMQEVVTWDSGQQSNRTAIEGNINAHYQIGNFGTPTSGLLATYTGAAAAYSVRQLANTAALAMRVREDGTDTELDIGFDSNGDLDTAAIASHCGANNGYVVTWYDQSGNQVDATQGTTTSQPQIYNGTAVITENGKPALDFDGSNDHFKMLFSSDLAQPGHHFAVAANDTATGFRILFSGNNNTSKRHQYEINTSGKWTFYAGSSITATASATTGQHLHSVLANGSSSNFYEDATLLASGNAGSFPLDGLTIGARTVTQASPWLGTIQEYVLYGTDQSSNRSGIESDINTYFSIY